MKLPHLNQLSASQLRSPIWAYDVVGQKMVWANAAALEDILNATNILLQQGYYYARPQSLADLTLSAVAAL